MHCKRKGDREKEREKKRRLTENKSQREGSDAKREVEPDSNMT